MKQRSRRSPVSLSGVEALDRLLGGGLGFGSSNLIMGPTGAGKSTIAALYACAAARRSDKAMVFVFDELPGTLSSRCEALGMPIQQVVDHGNLNMEQVDPAEMSPGEFAGKILRQVDSDEGLRVLVIDSLNGFVHAMSEERETGLHLHELLTSLSARGVITIITLAQHGLIGTMETQVDVSYLSDLIMLIRYFELRGEVRQAISVLKNRNARHERTTAASK